MLNRRSFLAGLVTLAAVQLAAEAQPAGRVPRIGVLAAITREAQVPFADAFREGLQSLGYADGQNLAIEWRYADGRAERFQELAEDLVRLNVEVIVAANQPAVEAARKATRTIPIVMILAVEDPVRRGFAASLARPGGNVTGFSPQTPEVIGKRLQWSCPGSVDGELLSRSSLHQHRGGY
jgi:putative tryptophan/tyrosine transport system substrate-binding protein